MASLGIRAGLIRFSAFGVGGGCGGEGGQWCLTAEQTFLLELAAVQGTVVKERRSSDMSMCADTVFLIVLSST